MARQPSVVWFRNVSLLDCRPELIYGSCFCEREVMSLLRQCLHENELAHLRHDAISNFQVDLDSNFTVEGRKL